MTMNLVFTDIWFIAYCIVVWILVGISTALIGRFLLFSHRFANFRSKYGISFILEVLLVMILIPLLFIWFLLTPVVFGNIGTPLGVGYEGEPDLFDVFIGFSGSIVPWFIAIRFGLGSEDDI